MDSKKKKAMGDGGRDRWNDNIGESLNRQLVGNFIQWKGERGGESWQW